MNWREELTRRLDRVEYLQRQNQSNCFLVRKIIEDVTTTIAHRLTYPEAQIILKKVKRVRELDAPNSIGDPYFEIAKYEVTREVK